ncbi:MULTISPECIES: diguanylate cyclase domain-containing protein [unclassified Pseudoalteromonas]|uniref:diguanylate cyclase domain-containing protein n=1 Tax=unclassified Pseudoalteromonas TaxID=194690 RepID=UPI002358C848|nr:MULTISPECIES: diguanylate cyclase [unclassified Pseudoalteromonas]MDC9563717.1 diguanylate cyclase [Pseudoalteromonas sp. GAB2316C]MDC9570641.1 diguanylate cyclase [Pseudoalteromonas sp. GABNB9D]MDC9572514.1 diguanylate cyclase [Pseudoalteromonas sp. GABNS16A]MDC9576664.1 diguanylate cyclase [Pseudoalteromonas sp. GABNS16E]MDC9584257.1 diguanylate cyclase [Pseudoalteromonas sp. GABNS16C]
MEDKRTEPSKLEHQNKKLRALLEKYRQSHHLQNALIQLSEQASTVAELILLYPAIHDILQKYVPSKSFYVVLLNEYSNSLELSYFADEKDGISVPLHQANSFDEGATGYVFKEGKTTYFTKQQMRDAADRGLFKALGTPAEHWVGVPVYQGEHIIGVLAAQSYDTEKYYSSQQIQLLEVMSLYLATAIERVKKRELLESEVKIRTRALTQSNEALNIEVEQRKRASQRQQILFKISEIATQAKNLNDAYLKIHQIIRTITYADNLYIALYNKKTGWIDFPYYADEFRSEAKPRRFAKGYSELVISTERTQLINPSRARELLKKGVVQRSTPVPKEQMATSWLGAPLKTSQGVIGLIVCQAYNNNHIFSNDDCELITFVSHQIATVLQTKLATQALKSSHQELEYRVNEKTKALQQANLHLQMQIDERKKVEQQLYHDAHHDSLTGLPNRSLFLTQLEKTLQHYHRFSDHHFAVLFIDLDKFKDINDQLGHHAGDQFLISVADLFSHCIREHDLLARLGGDEFVILLTHLTELQQAEDVADRIINIMKKPFCSKGTCIQSGASIGITYSNSSYQHTDEIIRDADAAMYYAKNAGRDRYELFHPLLTQTLTSAESPAQHHLDSLPMSFRSADIINLDEQQQSESLFEAFGEHPVLGYTSFEVLKKFATDKEQHLQVELELLQHAYSHALAANVAMVLLPCSGLLLEALEFNLFTEVLSKLQGQSQLCLLFDDQEIRYACATQLENLKKLSQLGYSIGLNNFAKDRCELNALTDITFDYVLLSSTFSKRVLQQESFNLQLQGVLAITQLKGIKVIAKGPSILNFRALLDKYGLNLFVAKQQGLSEPVAANNNAAQSIN